MSEFLRFLDIEGHRMAALVFNEDKPGIPVIFIHGITGSIYQWSVGQIPLIDERYRWYALSLPGHYPAAFPADFQREHLTAGMIGRVMSAAIRELVGDERVILVGHSTGGFAALEIATYDPELVAGIVSVSGFAHGKWTGALGLSQRIVRLGYPGELVFRLTYWFNQLHPRLNRPFWWVYGGNQKALYENLDIWIKAGYSAFQQLNLKDLTHYFARMPDINIKDDLEKITVPTLILVGDKDPIVPPAQSYVMTQAILDSSDLRIIRDCGHMPMMEYPDEYYRIVTEWLQEHFPVG